MNKQFNFDFYIICFSNGMLRHVLGRRGGYFISYGNSLNPVTCIYRQSPVKSPDIKLKFNQTTKLLLMFVIIITISIHLSL